MALSIVVKLSRDLTRSLDLLAYSARVTGCIQPSRNKITDAAKEFGLPDPDVTKKMYKRPKLRLQLQGLDLSKYTHKAIPYPKNGGRDRTGRIFNRRIGGGDKQKYRMIDFTRTAVSESQDLVEKVLEVRYDPLRSANIALVARGNHKRWIIASEGLKAGHLIVSSVKVPEIPVKYKEGDAHKLAAMAIGSVIHNIEIKPGEGGKIARAAGSTGVLVRKLDDVFVVKMPSKREMAVSKDCMATFGRPSNVEKHSRPVGSAQRSRWFGIRPKSGLWHRKTGYDGRKIKKPKPIKMYAERSPTVDWVDS